MIDAGARGATRDRPLCRSRPIRPRSRPPTMRWRAESSTSSWTRTEDAWRAYVLDDASILDALGHARLRVQHAVDATRIPRSAAPTSTTRIRESSSTTARGASRPRCAAARLSASTSSRCSCGSDGMAKLVMFGTGDIARLAHSTSRPTPARSRRLHGRRRISHGRPFLGLPLVDFEDVSRAIPAGQTTQMFVALSYAKMNRLRAEKYARRRRWATARELRQLPLLVPVATPPGDNCFILEDNTVQPFVTDRQQRDTLERQPHRPRLDDRRSLLHQLSRGGLRSRRRRRRRASSASTRRFATPSPSASARSSARAP